MTLIESMTQTPEDQRLFEQERVIVEVTEMISKLMEEQDVSKTELARRLETSRANVTQMLDGRRNMTLRTLVDVVFHLGASVSIAPRSIALGDDWYDVPLRVRCSAPSLSWSRVFGPPETLGTSKQTASSSPLRMAV